MYARVFTQILDSSISRNYLTRLVFMDCLLLAGEDGVLDITADAISRRTNIPLEIVLEAIKNLSEPDPDSRSGAEEGRRLVLLDPHRNWGWRIVNHQKYSVIKTREDKRTYDKNRYAQSKKTGKSIPVNDSTKFHFRSQNSVDSTHLDLDVDVSKPCASDDARSSIYTQGKTQTSQEQRAESDQVGDRPGRVSAPLRELTPEQELWFTTWWGEYWLHRAKKAAREAFRKQVKTSERFDQVIAATRAQKKDMLTREPSKRPHGATWLNGERWTDEITATAADDYYQEFES
jgi:hypothetical protein